ncbi:MULTISPECIES: dienelactone hydrolase family protein [unclassified Agrobacterium]|uniref:alpha/beta hydrolase family protein n=1 Tax=unclassified Agrobacterium TaxID=2632611 RepID=UPI002446B937|nr:MULTISPECIES: dienelactone hydrolase family protein [unclassified Agrobacterium]MDH0613293.1 prolyl oligopeptidase family serine peptidase [Agrobacterium sp. GD03872]MDH0697210.1 prolyl oligopeptidase family serine peptidase [Agrobacterium sp. GD03871]MDH1062143.1 prolyl oligopeptidase family serine peptidase [Agrobacterium sp. GD03992]MDH2213978.1 prolyl oligopeptidase family serine peptidase [Agrobacterium sp. GD03643]MDH2220576.1 prolyl oligopeptidase family serine peptidase [Agrobacteri
MRFLLSLCLFTVLFVSATGVSLAAGLRLIEVPSADGKAAMRAAIWSPCAATPGEVRIGPFLLPAVRDCPVPDGKYPLVIISHGFGGTYFSHRDTAAMLADSGFIVAAINHPGDSALDMTRAGDLSALTRRPADIARLLDYLLEGWSEARSIDAGRIGIYGFSRGGYAALVLAGGIPDFANAGLPCPDPQAPICAQMRQKTTLPQHGGQDVRVKAVVLADPLNAFPGSGAKNITIPVQLWSSERGGDGVTPQDIARLRDDLPTKPDFRMAKAAGHFSFIAPCPAEMAKAAPQICGDAAGFDRAEFHRGFNADVLSFLKLSLR